MDQQITMLDEKDVYSSLAHYESHQLIRQFVSLVDNSTFFFTLVICQKSNSLSAPSLVHLALSLLG